MKYNAKYFRDQLPAWKRKKDSLLARLLYRELSFYVSAFAANLGLSANTVSYISALVGIFGAGMFLVPSLSARIVGAILINFWVVLDCADGNIARCIKKEPFGEFADGISSYILVALMCTCFGMTVYFNGGILINAGNPWIIFLGALASTSDTLMRLTYQKFKNNERQMADAGVLKIEKDVRTDVTQVSNIRVRIEAELGLSATMTFILLLATIFNALDLIVMYYFLYFSVSCVGVIMIHIRKAIKAAKKYTM